MKVSLKKEINVIDVPEENSVVLTEITSDGYFRYKVVYRADPKKAIELKAITVKIEASSKPFIRQVPKILTANNIDRMVKNIQQKSSLAKDIARAQKTDVFFTYLSDISAKIPNTKTNTTRLALNPIITKETVVKLKPISDILKENIVLPVLENNIAGSVLPNLTREPTQAKAVSNELRFNGIDPVSLSGTRTNTIQSAKKVSSGLISRPNIPTNLTENQKNSLFGGLVNTINPSVNTQLQLSDMLNVLVDQPRTTVEIVEELEFPLSLLQGDFYLNLTLLNNNGIEIQSIYLSVPHIKNVSQFQIPTIPPKLEVAQTGIPGKNILYLKQMDLNAVGVSIYRKEIKTGIPQTDSLFSFVGNVDCTTTDDFVRVEDRVNNYGPIIYRAIPYSNDNVFSAEFAAAGSKGISSFGKRKTKKRRNFLSLFSKVTNEGIAIEIRDIPPGVNTLSLLRQDKTVFGDFSLVEVPRIISGEELSAPVVFLDTGVKQNRFYVYKVEMMYNQGDTEISSNQCIVEFNPITANIVNTFATPPVISSAGLDLDATFTLSSILISTNLDEIRNSLILQGLEQFYTSDIASLRQNLQNIIAYGIQRHNLTTGETEDFGIITTPNFSDILLGKTKGVKSLAAGSEYRYSVTTYFRAAETTLSSSERTVSTGLSSSYVLKPAKWRHPITLSYGNIVNEASLKRNHAKTPFSFGEIGSIIDINVSLANILPSIIEAKAQKLRKNSIILNWRIQGSVEKIDHFLVVLEILGMRTVVGKCHNISETNYFQFVDSLDDGEHGKLKYFIIPVYYDFSKGTEVSTNEVII